MKAEDFKLSRSMGIGLSIYQKTAHLHGVEVAIDSSGRVGYTICLIVKKTLLSKPNYESPLVEGKTL